MAKPKTFFASPGIPLYYQLENVLREKISSGTFSAGERLPTGVPLWVIHAGFAMSAPRQPM